MAKAVWNGKVIAESDTIEEVEGNVYFPENSLKREFFRRQHDVDLPVEGTGTLFESIDRRAGQSGCGLVLSRPKAGRPANQRIRGFLAWS